MGELDIAAVPALAVKLSVLAQNSLHIHADLRELEFCDVTGLNLLISTDVQLRARGGRLTLVGPCPALQLLLDTLGPAVTIQLAAPQGLA